MELIKQSFYLNEIAKLDSSCGDFYTYKVDKRYGNGKSVLFRVANGIYLSFNDLEFTKNIYNNTNISKIFTETLLKIEYCRDGFMFGKNIDHKECQVRTGEATYSVINNDFCEIYSKEKVYKGITVVSTIKSISKIYEDVFGIDAKEIREFYNQINLRNDFLAMKIDFNTENFLNELQEAYNKKDVDTIRLKFYQLLLYEFRNISEKIGGTNLYLSKSTINKVVEIEKYIKRHLGEKLSIDFISRKFSISPDILKKSFKKTYQISVYSYIKKMRLKKGKKLLVESDRRIIEIAFACGYQNHHSFSKAFKEEYLISPRDMRKGKITIKKVQQS